MTGNKQKKAGYVNYTFVLDTEYAMGHSSVLKYRHFYGGIQTDLVRK